MSSTSCLDGKKHDSKRNHVACRVLFLACAVVGCFVGRSLEAATPAPEPGSLAKRQAILDRLLQRLPPLPEFNDFLQRSGELPPDFDLMPSQFFLPDPMSWVEAGRARHATPDNWPERRRQMAEMMERWMLGSAPPAPGNVAAEILEKTSVGGYEIWNVRLTFGPNHAARLGVKLYLPQNRTPSGIFLCDSERYRTWAKKAMDQGNFGFAVHNARDGSGDDTRQYAELFGKLDWSEFRRRAWGVSRVVDWLITLPFVDPKQIYTGGHSRSGKVSVIAAAFDERLAGVISSSSGAVASNPFRFSDLSYGGVSVERFTSHHPQWANLRTRFFAGNEDKLPVDSHFLYALIAPRPLLTSTATEDSVEIAWPVEQVYQSIKPIYEMFGQASNLVVRYRSGGHTITNPDIYAAFSDFLLNARSGAQPLSELFPYRPLYSWDYLAWKARNPIDFAEFPPVNALAIQPPGAPVTAQSQAASRREVVRKIQWLLGDEIPYRKAPVVVHDFEALPVATRNHFSQITDAVDVVRPTAGAPNGADDDERASPARRTKESSVTATVVTFGDDVTGCLFTPKKGEQRPVVIWLAPLSLSHGFVPSRAKAEFAPVPLLRAGYPVFCFDPIGTGYRKPERREFFNRYPNASLMAKMVTDARHGIDATTELLKTPRPIFLYGYAMGGTVALLTAGLDERVAGLATAAGFTPWRTDTADRRTGGLARLSHLYGWLPRLGAFIGHEDRIPVDYPEILVSIAPRKVLVIAPTEDRYATLGEVRDAVAFARRTYAAVGNAHGIELVTPHDENRLFDQMHQEVVAWLGRQAPRGH